MESHESRSKEGEIVKRKEGVKREKKKEERGSGYFGGVELVWVDSKEGRTRDYKQLVTVGRVNNLSSCMSTSALIGRVIA